MREIYPENVDFNRTSSDYAKHRLGFPSDLFDRLQYLSIGLPGQHVLDLGTGTGTVARNFSLRGCKVVAIDIADKLMAEAKAIDTAVGAHVDYRVGKAEALDLPDASFNVVAAGQVWHWFDRPQAAAEAKRLLVKGGVLLIAHFDWIPLPGNVVEATEHLIEKHNSKWKAGGGMGLHPRWLADATGAGFADIETFSFDLFVPYTHEAWRGRVRASAGISASLTPEHVEIFDRQHEKLLRERFPDEPLAVHHRVWAMTAKKP